ncbi:MAG: aminoglycoside phosphotransferase family protein [Spirochaetaceae bacterium]|jgi:Ser/Thr protein kinase RdoA (MazF antagonist)|nr:aminoglycoside phosphotransferase family protein [Spirochaetaceae bacterium]
MNRLDLLKALLEDFAIYGDFESVEPFGSGHINTTFASRWNQAGVSVRYLHQRINEAVFHHPDQVMENITRVTAHIARQLARVPDRSRRTLTVVPARNGKAWVKDREGGWWRTYLFIEGTKSLEVVSSREEASFLGKCIGNFQKQLAGLGGPRLHETIPSFHDMEYRYRNFYAALEKNSVGRAASAAEEIAFMKENEERGSVLVRAVRTGRLPERICHNDTKMNNILIDKATSEALCVSDLDTVMPGTSLFDVGDLVRTVTTTAAEDEKELARVAWNAEYFRALLSGYLSEAAEFFTDAEWELLAEAGRNITQIMALRFLTDYLEGDHYYHIDRSDHNIDRCRNQIALIRSLDAEWKTALDIVAGFRACPAKTG